MDSIKFFNHPSYDEHISDWVVFRDLYRGDHRTMCSPKYLWQHELELEEARKFGFGKDRDATRPLRSIREERSRYINYLKPFIKRFVALLFRGELDVSGISPLFKTGSFDDLLDVDGQGTDIETFLKRVAVEYFLYGKAGILTDSFRVENVRSLQQQQSLGLRPYWELVPAMEIRDWQMSTSSARAGRFDSVRLQSSVVEDRASLKEQPITRLYTKLYQASDDGYIVERYKGPVLKDSRSLPKDLEWQLDGVDLADPLLKQIPLAVINGDSWVADLVAPALEIFNAESSLNSQLLYQAYQRIFASGNFQTGEGIVMNEGTVTLLPEGANVTVIQPSTPDALIRNIEQTKHTMISLAFSRTRLLPSDSRSVEAANTQRQAKEDFLATLVDAGRQLEVVFNQAISNYALFKKQTSFNEGIRLDLDITIEDLDEQIHLMQAFYGDMRRYDIWYKSALKKVASQMNLTNIDDIMQQIDTQEVESFDVANYLTTELDDNKERSAKGVRENDEE